MTGTWVADAVDAVDAAQAVVGTGEAARAIGRRLVSLVRRREEPPPPATREVRVDIHRQPLAFALDWQRKVIELWRRHPLLTPAFSDDLKAAGLYNRCVFLSASDTGPLRFRYIGVPTCRVFGDDWARDQLGKPAIEDVYSDYARAIDAQYQEAVAGGEPVFNRLQINGLAGAPVDYRHLLLGWTVGAQRRAVLALIDY